MSIHVREFLMFRGLMSSLPSVFICVHLWLKTLLRSASSAPCGSTILCFCLDPREAMKVHRQAILVFAITAVVVSTALFAWRGVWRGAEGSLDFTMVHASAHQWLHGNDPYPFDALYDVYVEQGGLAEGRQSRPRDPVWFASLYPPMTYAVLSPLGALDWPGARAGWLIINVLATLAVLAWLVRRRPARASAWSVLLVLAAVLASAPLHTTLAFGQLGLVTLALMLPAMTLALRGASETTSRWDTAFAGVALALAGALKPQLLAPIAVALLFTSAWRSVWFGVAVGVVITLIASLRIEATWLAHWIENVRSFADTGFADPSASNDRAYQMIHLSPLLHRLMPPDAARPLALLLPIVLFLLGIMRHVRSRDVLRLLSLASVVTLLVTYHRTYDAVMLAVPLVWAWARLVRHRRDTISWCVLVMLLLLAMPLPQALASLSMRGTLPTELLSQPAWVVVVLMHHNVLLVVLAVVLLVCGEMAGSSADGAESADDPEF